MRGALSGHAPVADDAGGLDAGGGPTPATADADADAEGLDESPAAAAASIVAGRLMLQMGPGMATDGYRHGTLCE